MDEPFGVCWRYLKRHSTRVTIVFGKLGLLFVFVPEGLAAHKTIQKKSRMFPAEKSLPALVGTVGAFPLNQCRLN